MNQRERYLKTMRFEKPDHVPFWKDWCAQTAIKRWKKEGLPEDVHFEDYFGFEGVSNIPVSLELIPAFEYKVIEETNEYKIFRDLDGSIRKQFKEYSGFGMPQWLEYPIKNRKDWDEFKKRLNPDSPARYPAKAKWSEMKEMWTKRDYPLYIHAGSFYGWLRNWIGVENISVMFYDDPDLIKEMMNYITDFAIKTISKAVNEIKDIDEGNFWEDMCYKTGPLVSPEMFKEFMLPCYKKVTGFLKEHGIELNWVDCDGNIEELLPLWIEGGVTGFYPLEVAAGMDAGKLREKYGNKIVLWGNVDKRALAKGKKEIDKEMDRIALVVEKGGFIPLVDHAIPEDVSYENWLYYLKLRKKICGIKDS